MIWMILALPLIAATFAYLGAPLALWTLAGAAWLGAAAWLGSWPALAVVLAGGGYLLVAALFNLKPLRRALVSAPLLAGYRKILPPMSDTERIALEAGTVWWEGELFRGRPDWTKLLAFPQPTLTAEEQRFLDNETEELCRMSNDWECSHELGDLPPHVWQFIREKGFLGMIIPRQYGGK